MSSTPDSARHVFFHVHVRKCGGSTFYRTILKRNFGDGFYRDSSLIDDRYSVDQVREILANCPWLSAYSSHKISLELPYDASEQVWSIAFVRDPVQRFVSHYHYLRDHARDWDPLAKQLSLSEYAERAIREQWLRDQRQHSQLSQLVNSTGDAGLDRVHGLVSQGRVLLFPIERFDEACVLLEAQFPGDFQDCSYSHRVNASSPDRGEAEQTAEEIRERLTTSIAPAEFALIETARQECARRIEAVFPKRGVYERRLAGFRDRCRSRPKRKIPWFGWRSAGKDRPI